MHKGDYHTDYSKYYDKEYKEKDLAFEHIKELKQEQRDRVKSKEDTKEEIHTENAKIVKRMNFKKKH